MAPKVLAYITREGPHGKELLVFRHAHHPEAGLQVPGGSVDPGESLPEAVLREVAEETGLTGLELNDQIARDPYYVESRAIWQERNVFHLRAASDLPDSWLWVVSGGLEDTGLHFEFFWLPLDEAERKLDWGLGQWVDLI